VRVLGHPRRQDFDGNVPPELEVFGLVDFPLYARGHVPHRFEL